MFYTKSKAAFLLSAERLFSFGENVYLWTFTFDDVYDDCQYAYLWHGFSLAIGGLYGGYLAGLRVVEVHPGGRLGLGSHGLHYHLLVNRRLNVHMVARLGKRWHIGWIHVVKRKIDYGSALYLAKYMSKGRREDNLRGIRRWACMWMLRGVKKNEVRVESPYMVARRRVLGREKVPIGWEELLRQVFDLGGEAQLRLVWRIVTGKQIGRAHV